MWKKWFLNSLWNTISSVARWVNEEIYNLVSVSAIKKLILALKSSSVLFSIILNSFGHDLETAAAIIPAAETFSYLPLFAQGKWCSKLTTGSLTRHMCF